jgi:hypothetical protein
MHAEGELVLRALCRTHQMQMQDGGLLLLVLRVLQGLLRQQQAVVVAVPRLPAWVQLHQQHQQQ